MEAGFPGSKASCAGGCEQVLGFEERNCWNRVIMKKRC
jgi:hypothetical protein